MHIFDRLTGGSGIQLGLCNAETPGHLGVWATWGNTNAGLEVYRVVLSANSADGAQCLAPTSYTFAPAFVEPFLRCLESTYEMKHFLAGWDRAKEGKFTLEFFLSEQKTLLKVYTLEEAAKALRGKDGHAPGLTQKIQGYLAADVPEVAKLKHAELKAHSEAAKKALEEKKLKEEEERKKKEEEKAKAAADKLAAAQKAAQAASKPAGEKPSGPTIQGGKVALFYGSSTGHTEDIAKQIRELLGPGCDHIKNVSDCHPTDFTICETMILGVPTWHIGEMQDDWAATLGELKKQNYAGKKIAIFGLGDGKGYPDTYVDAMQELAEVFEKTGAKLHGLWPTQGYEYKASKAIRDGKFMGLVIDVENQDNLSDARVKKWVEQIRKELGI